MIPRFFIDRPIFASVLSIVVVLAGAVAVFNLPLAQYPEVAPPTVIVTASYPGANALTVRDTVAAPIEEQVSGVEGMMYMSSQSTNDGSYTLTVTFKLGTNPDIAQVLVQNRVSLATPIIPDIVQREGIVVKKQSPNTLMIVNLVSTTGRYRDDYLSNYATIEVRDELGRLPGVGAVGYLGQRDYSMRVWLDPDRLAARSLTAADVVAAIEQQNVQVAAGQIGQQPVPKGQQYQLTINARGRLVDAEEFRDIIVKVGTGGPAGAQTAQAASAGASMTGTTGATAESGSAAATSTANNPSAQTAAVVRLRDVVSTPRQVDDAQGTPRIEGGIQVVPHQPEDKEMIGGVQLGAQQYDQTATLDGRPTVGLTISALPGANALQTADAVKRKMEELKKRFPEGLDYRIAYDTTPFIRQSVEEVFVTLADAILLVAIVVLVFLQSWRAALIPLVAVPVAVVGTFAVMFALGFTLNTLTLFGLVLAIGIVVDDAIVVVENVERWLEKGLEPKEATRKAMDEVTGPVIAIALVLCAVFVPAAFIGGVTGQFFRQFAVTIAVSTLLSAFNSLTLSPALAALLLRRKKEGEHHHSGRIENLIWAAGTGAVVGWLLVRTELWAPLGPTVRGPLGLLWFAVGWVAVLLAAAAGFFHQPLFRLFNRGFDAVTGGYARTVRLLLKPLAAVLVLLVYGGLLVATGFQFTSTPTGFVPQQDKGYLILNVQLPDSASVERTRRQMTRIEQACRDTPGVESTVGISGQSLILNANAPNLGSMYVVLADFERRTGTRYSLPDPSREKLKAGGMPDPVLAKLLPLRTREFRREAFEKEAEHLLDPEEYHTHHAAILDAAQATSTERTADSVARELEERCRTAVRGARVRAFGAPPIEGLGTTGGFKMVVEDRGNLGPADLQRASDGIVAGGNDTPGLTGLFNTARFDTPWVELDINRTKCLSLGVTVEDVFAALQYNFGSYYVNNFTDFGRNWQVNVQADPAFRDRVRDVGRIQVRTGSGRMVPLNTVLSVRDTSGPVLVQRYNMYAAAVITGDVTPGTSTGDAVPRLEGVANGKLPRAMAFEWTELTYLQNQVGNTAIYAFVLAVVFVFLVLAAQYESWKMPLAVILVVPMCLLFALVGVNLAGQDITVFTQIGLIVLVGLACKNAILIVEFAKQRTDAGDDPAHAVVEASRLRMRPILMTSFAFIFGVVPLVLSSGAGAEMRKSLGVAVFAGMIGVTLFGVFLTPVFFRVVQWFGRKTPAQPEADTKPEPAAAATGGNETVIHPASP